MHHLLCTTLRRDKHKSYPLPVTLNPKDFEHQKRSRRPKKANREEEEGEKAGKAKDAAGFDNTSSEMQE